LGFESIFNNENLFSMPLTTCHIDDQDFRLEYEKTSITSGTLYHGTVYQNHIFEFFFVVFKNGDPVLFSPLDTESSRKNIIVETILDFEKNG
jgi:hypothetical protein